MTRVPPSIESRCFGLAPAVSITLGAIAISAGVGLTAYGWSIGFAVAGLIVGFVFVRAGAKDAGVERGIAAEIARARSEWPALESGIREAEQQDQARVAAFLRDRGYRHYVVRRWILAELGADISLGGSPRDP